jgi:hypothetical protein
MVAFTGTNLIDGGTVVNVSGGTGLTIANLAVLTSTSMTGFATLGDSGSYAISVSTAGGTSSTVPFMITPNLLASATHFAVSHFAGPNGSGSADGTGSAARFNSPQRNWSDGTNLYIADSGNQTIRKVVIATGATTTVAGLPGFAGAVDGVGTAARFNSPSGIWGDGTNLYVSDLNNHAIRKIVLATGAVTTFSGILGSSGITNSPARFTSPGGLCSDGTNLFVADSGNNVIRKIVISSFAVSVFAGSGSGLPGSLDGTGAAARFNNPQGIFCDGTNLWVADTGNNQIRKVVVSSAQVTTVAGNSTQSGSADGTGGTSGTARFFNPTALWGDGTNLYVADNINDTVRKVAVSNGQTTTLSGLALSAGSTDGTGAPGGTARFDHPSGVWGTGSTLYVSDTGSNNTIRSVAIANGSATTLVGSAGGGGTSNGTGATARFNSPRGLTGDGTYLYLSDTNSGGIRKATISSAVVNTLAGGIGYGSMDGAGSVAQFGYPDGIWTDGVNAYVADNDNSTIRKVNSATGFTSTLAGTAQGYGFVDATGTAARFLFPGSVWGDGVNLYVADTDNHAIRRIVIANGFVTTFAGNGTAGSNDAIGTNATFNYPNGIWGDGTYLYVADTFNLSVRKINIATREVSTLVNFTDYPVALWGDRSTLYVAVGNYIARVAINSATVSSIAGGHSGSDDGLDFNAGMTPSGIWGNASELYVSDGNSNSIRKLVPATLSAPTLSSIAPTSGARNTTIAVTLKGTNFIPGATSVAVSGTLVTASSVTVTGPGTIVANFTIASGAATGPRNVTVTTSAGTTGAVTFTVN